MSTKKPKKPTITATSSSPIAAPSAVQSTRVPVVGIGASAGGLEAFEAFFHACPATTDMAFVLVPHLDPGHESLLTEILQRCTAMPVEQVQDLTAVAPNHVYIIPPNREMAILNGVLHLAEPQQARGRRMPIDDFLCSLAEDQQAHAIGVILSGTATDGTLGLRAIFNQGGVCMVQEPTTAKYDGMPQNAINASCVTHILAVDQMPAMLVDIVRQLSYRKLAPAVVAPEQTFGGINKILLQLRTNTGHDFSLYKKGTIGRRISRRMAAHHIDDEATYARFLKENPAEVPLLFKELLINVTSFFRDPDAFVALKQTILPPLLLGKPAAYVFRVWVAGCSTGEEAYSIAMVLHELLDEFNIHHEQTVATQIYATDLDDEAINVARTGRYPLSIQEHITPERLRRFFTKDDAGYKIKKEIRDMVVFAVQNVVKDPPFTKLDLLSCRNLMIYLEPELQSHLINTFHYALRPNGVLFLSTSESINSQAEVFVVLDRKWKFYQARHADTVTRPKMINTLPLYSPSSASTGTPMATLKPKPTDIVDISHRVLLQTYAPASVTVSAIGDILYVHGDTGRYLRPAPGLVNNNVVEMAREGLQAALRSAILLATTNATPMLSEEVAVKTNGGFSQVRFSVQRLLEQINGQNMLLISFQDVAQPLQAGDNAAAKAPSGGKKTQLALQQPVQQTLQQTPLSATDVTRIKELEMKLAYSNETLKAHNEEQQAFYEELKSSNEELQSTNEELQSSNEELETSKEELQSLNEETITVNAELNARIEQLTTVKNDMKNLLDSIGTGMLFLDHQLCIRRHTPAAAKIYRLIATDVGRPLTDITSNLSAEVQKELYVDLQKVLDTLIPAEREVQIADGDWYLMRIQPYRTLDNVIEGVVLTFTTITNFKLASESKIKTAAQLAASEQQTTQIARELAEGIVNTVTEPLIVLNNALSVVSANTAFYQCFHVEACDTVNHAIFELGNGQWNIPVLRELLENVLPQNQAVEGYVVEHDFEVLGKRRMVLNARRVCTAGGNTELILLAIISIESMGA